MQTQIELLERINDNEEVRETLLNYIEKSRKFRYKLIKFFYYYKRPIFILSLIVSVSLVLFLFVLLSGFVISRITEVFSILALILSLAGIMFRMMNIKEYAVKELNIERLKDNLYELNFLIKNAGYGKMKLDFAFYLVENKEFNNTDDFFNCTSMKMWEYFGNLLKKLDKSKDEEMELYSLRNILKDRGVFYTHEGFDTETRLKEFRQNRLYKITFFFLTSTKVNYQTSKYVIT